MNITQVQANDEIVYEGARRIVTAAPKRLGTSGEAGRLIRVRFLSVDRAGIRENGVLEFGTTGENTYDLDESTEVDVLRSGVEYRTSADYVRPYDGGSLSAEDLKSEREGASRSELARVALRRKAREGEANLEEASFREAIQKALNAGIGVAEIRQETGLSRERVYQIRDGRR